MNKERTNPAGKRDRVSTKRFPDPLFWLLLPVVLYVSLLLILPGQRLDLELKQAQLLDSDWVLSRAKMNGQAIQLPADLEWPAGEPLAIHTVLPQAFSDQQTILIRSSLQSLSVLLDGAMIHHYDRHTQDAPRSPLASSWHMVRIPDHSDGKTLELVLRSPYASMSGQINSVLYGNKASLMYWLVSIYGPGLFLCILQILVGLTLLTVAFFMPAKSRKSLWALGSFAVLMGAWFLAESRMMQFFLPNELIIGSLAYVSLALCPVPFLILISDSILPEQRNLFSRLITLFSIHTILIQLLQFLGWADFFSTVWITNLLIVLSMCLVFFILVKSWFTTRRKEIARFLAAFSILAFFAFLEFANFLRSNFAGTSFSLRLGMVTFLLILAYQSLRNARQIMLQNQSTLIYEKMAFEDILTGLGNRAAFERDTAGFNRPDSVAAPIRLVSMDLNNLKWINDNLGHAAGDEAIRMASNSLKQHFSPLGSCYRLGGDEFACLIKPDQPSIFQHNLERFREQVEKISSEVAYPFSIAIGSAVYQTGSSETFHDFQVKVDQLMYSDKQNKPVL